MVTLTQLNYIIMTNVTVLEVSYAKITKMYFLWSPHRGKMGPLKLKTWLDIKIDVATDLHREYEKLCYSQMRLSRDKQNMLPSRSKNGLVKTEQRFYLRCLW